MGRKYTKWSLCYLEIWRSIAIYRELYHQLKLSAIYLMSTLNIHRIKGITFNLLIYLLPGELIRGYLLRCLYYLV